MTAMTDVASKELAAVGTNDDGDDEEYESYKIIKQVVQVQWSDKS